MNKEAFMKEIEYLEHKIKDALMQSPPGELFVLLRRHQIEAFLCGLFFGTSITGVLMFVVRWV